MDSIWEFKIWLAREVMVLVLVIFFFSPLHDVSEHIWTYFFKKAKNVYSGRRADFVRLVGAIAILGGLVLALSLMIIHHYLVTNK